MFNFVLEKVLEKYWNFTPMRLLTLNILEVAC